MRVDLESNKLMYVRSVQKNQLFNSWKTVAHIPRETVCHVHYFIKTEGSLLNGSVISTKYCPSPIAPGRLEIPLLLKLSCLEQKTFEKMKNC